MIGDALGAFLDFLFKFLPMVFGVMILAAIAVFLWMAMAPDEPSGRCQTELGYGGQADYVECEETR